MPESLRHESEPLYLQIERRLRREVTALSAAAIAPMPFPGDEELGRTFGASRMTVRRAMESLVREGLLVRVRGVGTFITAGKVEGQLSEIERFFREWRSQGLDARAEVRTWAVVGCPEVEAETLGLVAGEPVLHLVRLRYADGLPVALDDRFVPTWAAGVLTPEDVCRESIFIIIAERLGLRVTHADLELWARLATPEEADLLSLGEALPVLVRRVTIHAQVRGPMLTGTSAYCGDRFRYRLRVDNRPGHGVSL